VFRFPMIDADNAECVGVDAFSGQAPRTRQPNIS
jgi:hypothetical protein